MPFHPLIVRMPKEAPKKKAVAKAVVQIWNSEQSQAQGGLNFARGAGLHSIAVMKKKETGSERMAFKSHDKNSEDAIRSVLGSAFSPFDHVTQVRMQSLTVYASKKENFRTITSQDLENQSLKTQLAAVYAERMVRGDADLHPENLGVAGEGNSATLISFDFDRTLEFQRHMTVKEIDTPVYVEANMGWEISHDEGDRPYNHPHRGWLYLGDSAPYVVYTNFRADPLLRGALEKPDLTDSLRALAEIAGDALAEPSSRDSSLKKHGVTELKDQYEGFFFEAPSIEIKRQHWMHLAWNTCLDSEWLAAVKKTLIDPKANHPQKKLAGRLVKQHVQHLINLRGALLRSSEFRDDFIEHFDEYGNGLKNKIETYNAQYPIEGDELSEKKKAKNTALRIDAGKVLVSLGALMAEVRTEPEISEAMLLEPATDDRMLQDKILEVLAYCNMSGVTQDSKDELTAKLTSLMNRLSNWISRQEGYLEPRDATESYYFFRDARAQLEKLGNNSLLVEKLNQLEKNYKAKALAYYKKRPQEALDRLGVILKNGGQPIELDQILKTLTLFVMHGVRHEVTDKYPVLVCMGEKVEESECGLTKEQITEQVLDLVKTCDVEKLDTDYYKFFIDQVERFSAVFSAAQLDQFHHYVEKNFDELEKQEEHQWILQKKANFEKAKKATPMTSKRDRKVELLLKIARDQSTIINPDDEKRLREHHGFKILSFGCAMTNSMKCVKAMQAYFEMKAKEPAAAVAKKDEAVRLFNQVLAVSELSDAVKTQQADDFKKGLA